MKVFYCLGLIVLAERCLSFYHKCDVRVCGTVVRMNRQVFLAELGKDISSNLGVRFQPTRWKQGSEGASHIVSTGVVTNDEGLDFFVKSGSLGEYEMFAAEFEGISEIYGTKTIRVPRPVSKGSANSIAYVVFEKLSLGGRADPAKYADKLIAMHQCSPPNGTFGWKRNNTIGPTFQPNNYCSTWVEFWDKYRLGHMIQLARAEGAAFPNEGKLREKVKTLLEQHSCSPSLLHGDLWSGNQGATTEGEPVIFDPSVYVSVSLSIPYLTKFVGSMVIEK